MMNKTIGLTVLCSVLSVSAYASVTESTTAAIRVDYSDINVTTSHGQAKLLSRIERAAKSVCGSTLRSDVTSLKQAMNNRTCIKQKTAEAMETIDLKMLSAL